jgi:hypothetical protein
LPRASMNPGGNILNDRESQMTVLSPVITHQCTGGTLRLNQIRFVAVRSQRLEGLVAAGRRRARPFRVSGSRQIRSETTDVLRGKIPSAA